MNDADILTIEAYRSCSLKEGLDPSDLFTPRTCQSIWKLYKRLVPVMCNIEGVRRSRQYVPIPCERFSEPVDNYRTLNGDGLISVCMKINDDARRHEIVVFDHLTEELKQLGSIPRHRFNMSYDAFVFNMDDPQFVEGVIGALTHDAQFVVIYAHSKNLRVVSVFNIPNAVCLFEKNLSQSEYFADCKPTGVALVPSGPSKTEFSIAVLSKNMEVRVWNTADRTGRIVRLEDARPSFGLSLGVINARESFLKFSPDGRYLCVLAYVDSKSTCVVMDGFSLQALFKMPYDFTYGPLCCIFPCFTPCGSKFAMFLPNKENYYDIDNYQLHLYEIPRGLQCLKDLCRVSILATVDRSNLSKLSLPQDLIIFLTAGDCNVPILENPQKNCRLM